jgi:hypothetical protein
MSDTNAVESTGTSRIDLRKVGEDDMGWNNFRVHLGKADSRFKIHSRNGK